jgi:hypothetical protein
MRCEKRDVRNEMRDARAEMRETRYEKREPRDKSQKRAEKRFLRIFLKAEAAINLSEFICFKSHRGVV